MHYYFIEGFQIASKWQLPFQKQVPARRRLKSVSSVKVPQPGERLSRLSSHLTVALPKGLATHSHSCTVLKIRIWKTASLCYISKGLTPCWWWSGPPSSQAGMRWRIRSAQLRVPRHKQRLPWVRLLWSHFTLELWKKASFVVHCWEAGDLRTHHPDQTGWLTAFSPHPNSNGTPPRPLPSHLWLSASGCCFH